MSIFKKTAKAAVLIPIILIALFIAFENFGAIVNSAATSKQTSQVIHDIETLLHDPVVSDAYSETGNTSGTGNHVDMLSIIVFQTDDSIEEIIEKLQDKYDFNEWYCRVEVLGDIQEKPDVYCRIKVVLNEYLTKGDVEVLLLDKKKQAILRLNRQQPFQAINLDGQKADTIYVGNLRTLPVNVSCTGVVCAVFLIDLDAEKRELRNCIYESWKTILNSIH